VVDALTQVEREVRELIRRSGVDPVREGDAVRGLVADVVADYDERSMSGSLPTLPDPAGAVQRVWDAVAGFGALQPFLDDPRVEEIWVNEPSKVFVAREGVALPLDDVAAGPPADHEAVARKILLDQLTGAARSRSELSAKLARKHVPEQVAERLLDRFEEVGLVDDQAFARAWVQSRQPGKGLARRALAQELRRKGIDDELVKNALAELDPDQEAATARSLVRRKLPSTAGLATDARVRRLAGMLARKGYGPGLAFRIVKEELEREGSDTAALVLDTDGLASLE